MWLWLCRLHGSLQYQKRKEPVRKSFALAKLSRGARPASPAKYLYAHLRIHMECFHLTGNPEEFPVR